MPVLHQLYLIYSLRKTMRSEIKGMSYRISVMSIGIIHWFHVLVSISVMHPHKSNANISSRSGLMTPPEVRTPSIIHLQPSHTISPKLSIEQPPSAIPRRPDISYIHHLIGTNHKLQWRVFSVIFIWRKGAEILKTKDIYNFR